MSFYKPDKRIESLRNVIKTLLTVYSAIVPSDRHITVRYVNERYHDKKTQNELPKELATVPENPDDDPDANIPTEVEKRVDSLVNKIPFNGLSRIAYALKNHVLEDLVYMNTRPAAPGKLRNIGKMKRPLQVFIITDGEVSSTALHSAHSIPLLHRFTCLFDLLTYFRIDRR